MVLPLLRGGGSTEGCTCLDAEMAEIAKTVFGDCGADGGEGFVIAYAHGRECVPDGGVVKGSVGGGECLHAEMHDEGEPFPVCDELAMLVGAIGSNWGWMPGDAGEGHVDVLAVGSWIAPNHGREERAAGYGGDATMPIVSQTDADVPVHRTSAGASDAGSSHGRDGAMDIEADAVGGGADGVLRPEFCNVRFGPTQVLGRCGGGR